MAVEYVLWLAADCIPDCPEEVFAKIYAGFFELIFPCTQGMRCAYVAVDCRFCCACACTVTTDKITGESDELQLQYVERIEVISGLEIMIAEELCMLLIRDSLTRHRQGLGCSPG